MSQTPSDFRQAVSSYGFPTSDPVYSVVFGSSDGAVSLDKELLCLFRAAGDSSGWYKTLTDFWANALFNFLEDCFDDERFEELGEAGEYREPSPDDASQPIAEFFAHRSSEYMEIPSKVESCFLVHDTADFKSFVGRDHAGFFAIFFRSYEG
ncbi:MAG: hypothetical protein JSV89_17485 [Spirochaetaceae bacterium]|nr:MAG: hypothetical protein JSV89_17485 [Spirochaetaceae bacterium]